MVNKGNHPQMALLFRLVKYYNLPRYIHSMRHSRPEDQFEPRTFGAHLLHPLSHACGQTLWWPGASFRDLAMDLAMGGWWWTLVGPNYFLFFVFCWWIIMIIDPESRLVVIFWEFIPLELQSGVPSWAGRRGNQQTKSGGLNTSMWSGAFQQKTLIFGVYQQRGVHLFAEDIGNPPFDGKKWQFQHSWEFYPLTKMHI